MNFLHIAGHLGSDPEIRYTSNGKKVTVLRLAAKIRKNNADDTLWWRVTIWGDQYDNMIPYLKKGSPILVFGELSKPEIYTDKNGQPQVSMGITASSISFSPFGRGDKTQMQDTTARNTNPTNSAASNNTGSLENSFDSANKVEPKENNFVSNSVNNNQDFNDDEVPF